MARTAERIPGLAPSLLNHSPHDLPGDAVCRPGPAVEAEPAGRRVVGDVARATWHPQCRRFALDVDLRSRGRRVPRRSHAPFAPFGDPAGELHGCCYEIGLLWAWRRPPRLDQAVCLSSMDVSSDTPATVGCPHRDDSGMSCAATPGTAPRPGTPRRGASEHPRSRSGDRPSAQRSPRRARAAPPWYLPTSRRYRSHHTSSSTRRASSPRTSRWRQR